MFSRLATPFARLPIGCSTVVACALLLATAAPASAQFQIPGGGGNIGGGNTGGGNFGGGNTGGGRNTGGSSSRGGGSSRGTGGAAGADSMRSADDVFSAGVSREGAPEERQVGRANGATDNALGAGGAGRVRGMGGFGGMGGLGGFGGLGGLGGFNQFGGNQFGNQSQQNRAVRTRLLSGVESLPSPPRAVGATVNTRLSSLPSNGRFAGVGVQMQGRTAILVGQVASEADKRMAKLMVRLEPGVSEIDDRLEVAGQ